MKERIDSARLPDKEPMELFRKGEYLIIAKVDCDGEPYVMPFNYIVKDHCDQLEYDRISFQVVGNTKALPNEFGTLFESVIISGEAGLVDDQKEKQNMLNEFFRLNFAGSSIASQNDFDCIKSKIKILKIKIKNMAACMKE